MSTGTSALAGQQARDRAQDRAQQVAAQAQEKAQEAATKAKSRLREQLDQRSSRTGEQINEQASDLRTASESLRQEGKDGPARAADRLAEYAEKVGGYLRDKDSDGLLSDAEDLARRQPWAVGAAALALGFAASRFLKASSSKRYSARHAEPGSAPVPVAPTTTPRPSMPPPASPAPAGTPGRGERPLGSTPPIGPTSGA
jgi:hypothetical protein